MTIVETLPIGQQWLIKCMQKLTDQPLLNMGVCYGLAQTSLLEILDQGDATELNKIFNMINSIPINSFKSTIENIHRKYLELVKAAKEKAFLELNSRLNDNSKDDLNTNGQKTVDEKALKELSRKYINQGLATFSDDEKTQLRIRSLLESIELAQIPFMHADVLNRETIEQGDESVPRIICSNKLNSQDDYIMKLDTMSGIFTLKELTALFEQLQKTLEDPKLNYPFSFLLNNLNHAISISFVPNKGWIYVDANKLPAKTIKDPNKVASKIISSFEGHGNSAFVTNIYVTKKNEADARARLDAFKATAVWKGANEVSEEKVNAEDATQSTWLYVASRSGDTALVNKLLQAKADPNHVTYENTRPLFIAAYSGHLDIVKLLIKSGAEVDAQNDGDTALFMAAAKNYLEIVKELLSAGANPNFIDNKGLSALAIAAQRGNVEIVKFLMRHVGDAKQYSKALLFAAESGKLEVVQLFCKMNLKFKPIINLGLLGMTPLYMACVKNYPKVAKLLLDFGADPNIYALTGKTPIMGAAEEGNLEIVDLLLKVVTDKKQLNGALCLASKEGRIDVLKTLLKRNEVDVNILLNDVTPLYLAAYKNHMEVVKLLIDRGADPNQANLEGITPLMSAAAAGNTEMVELLLSYVNDPQQFVKAFCFAAEQGQLEVVNLFINGNINLNETVDGSTALQVAVANNKSDVVKALIEAGADTACKDASGRTPLIVAAANGYTDVVKLLLKPDDVEIKTPLGENALMAAISNNHVVVAKLLLDANSDVNLVDKAGITPLLLAIQNDNFELVEELIKHHANVNEENAALTPLFLAAENGNLEIMQLLIENGAVAHTKVNGKTAYDAALENGNNDAAAELMKVRENEDAVKANDGAVRVDDGAVKVDDGAKVNEDATKIANKDLLHVSFSSKLQSNLKLFKPASIGEKMNEKAIHEEEADNIPAKSVGC